MSHFMTLALLPGDTVDREAIAALLAPYDEGLEVPAYDQPCRCVGHAAHKAVIEQLDAEMGTIEAHRESFHKLHPGNPWSMTEEEVEALDEAWEKSLSPRNERQRVLLEAHRDRTAPDPECDSCHGRGLYTTTYNPRSKWDWWSIGGRFTGALSDYDPEKDPLNQRTCQICAGTGQRNDALGRERRARDPKYTCNGCSGTGRSLAYPSEWPNIGNDGSVQQMLADWKKKYIPFAVLTPDGAWHERGRMGWWAMVQNKKPLAEWEAEVFALLANNRGCMAVVLDLHI